MRETDVREGPLAFALRLVLVGCVAALSASTVIAQEYAGALRVAGGREQRSAGSSYRLDISYDAGLLSANQQAILVYAEPSHSLLLANTNAAAPVAEEYREALALMKGRAESFHHSVTLPFRPFLDHRIVVITKGADGQERVLADAQVNLRSFSFTTTFAASEDFGDPTATQIHCCWGPRCSQECVECDGPEFTCDLIECTIQCGHDDDWPPHV